MAKKKPLQDTTSVSQDEERYQTLIFLNAVIPVLKPIIAEKTDLQKGFRNRDAVVQISCLAADGVSIDGRKPRLATCLVIDDGKVGIKLGPHPAPNLEIEFSSRKKLNDFFTGKVNLPKFHGGLSNIGLLIATVKALLAMASLLGHTEAPHDQTDQALLTKCMFYLLTSGISQLNKAGHPAVTKWSKVQPDRVYQLQVKGHPELGGYLRVKAGKTKAFRGEYSRSKPFFAMAFDSPLSALGILQETDDMIDSTQKGKIEMQGAPEYGAELGDLMFLVGGYAK